MTTTQADRHRRPTATGKTELGRATRPPPRGRNHRGGLAAGLPPHGHRHRQADGGRAGRGAAPPDRHVDPDEEFSLGPGWIWRRRRWRTSGRGGSSRSWSAGRASTSGRCWRAGGCRAWPPIRSSGAHGGARRRGAARGAAARGPGGGVPHRPRNVRRVVRALEVTRRPAGRSRTGRRRSRPTSRPLVIGLRCRARSCTGASMRGWTP